MHSREELVKKIEDETKLIKELESTYPNDINSTQWAIHDTKLRDAYWRRRNWIGYLEDPEYSPYQNFG